MRNIISGIALLMIVMLTLTGCEKDYQTLLTDGVWTFKNLTTDSEDETITGLITFAKAVTNGFQPLGGVGVGDKVASVLTSRGGEFAHGFT